MCLEEGTLAGWLHEVLEPHVAELVGVGIRKSPGAKSDRQDAFGLGEQLWAGDGIGHATARQNVAMTGLDG